MYQRALYRVNLARHVLKINFTRKSSSQMLKCRIIMVGSGPINKKTINKKYLIPDLLGVIGDILSSDQVDHLLLLQHDFGVRKIASTELRQNDSQSIDVVQDSVAVSVQSVKIVQVLRSDEFGCSPE